MSKKKRTPKARRAPRSRKTSNDNVVWHQSADEATLARKPRYNGFACGHGAHGDAKYNRAKAKRRYREYLGQEGASRGSFPFVDTYRDGMLTE